MVSPRLSILGQLDRGLSRTQDRLSGLVQRGRVRAIDTTYFPALLEISLYLRGGQTATLNRVQLVGDFARVAPSELDTVLLGKDVLLLCPSGRPAEEAYVVGIVSVAVGPLPAVPIQP